VGSDVRVLFGVDQLDSSISFLEVGETKVEFIHSSVGLAVLCDECHELEIFSRHEGSLGSSNRESDESGAHN
jgi:hypothetical protein